jgi:hypothetical protein
MNPQCMFGYEPKLVRDNGKPLNELHLVLRGKPVEPGAVIKGTERPLRGPFSLPQCCPFLLPTRPQYRMGAGLTV